ncbi:MAG: hypothetical protein FWD17_08385 [Polyangiaceae bacterium]|nr:hypothetical protein [Polyangiaceae bacterium]
MRREHREAIVAVVLAFVASSCGGGASSGGADVGASPNVGGSNGDDGGGATRSGASSSTMLGGNGGLDLDGGSGSQPPASSADASSEDGAVASHDSGAVADGQASGDPGEAGASVQFPPNCTCLGLGPPACTPTGHITYTLTKSASPTADEQSAYDAITCAMDGAMAYYNCNTNITKQLTVSYNTSVQTADGNFNGSIRFGGTSYMECVTAMHETAHAVGIGTAPAWSTYSVGGVFTGANAIAQLRAITGNPDDVLHSDTQHFWPYGLNYTSEAKSTADLVDHCLMVVAIRKDLGL